MGLMNDALSGDYQIAGHDRGQTVTYLAKRQDADVEFPIELAVPRDYSLKEQIASQGLFSSADKEWGLGCDQFIDGLEPQAGDKITDEDGIVWVLSGNQIGRGALKIKWVVHTVKARGTN